MLDDIISNYNVIEDERIFDNVDDFNKSDLFNTYNINVLHCNIRSIKKNINSLDAYINSLKKKTEIVVVSESFLKISHGIINIEGYLHYTNGSKLNRNDRVIIYVAKNLKHEWIIEQFGDLKIISVTLELQNKNKFKISGIYRCFDLDVNNFIENLNTFIKNSKDVMNHVIVGDTNIDILKNELLNNKYLNNF